MTEQFETIITYCEQLTFNNNRQWFHDNHEAYLKAKEYFEDFIDIMKYKLLDKVPEIGIPLFNVEPKAMEYRIPRDARALGSKPPYNPSFRAFFSPDRHSWKPESYFIKIGSDEVFTGCGLFFHNNSEIVKARRYMASHAEEMISIIPNSNGFSFEGTSLKKMPSEFPSNHPLGRILKMKNWEITYNFSFDDLGDFDSFSSECINRYLEMEKLRKFFMRVYKYAVSDDSHDEIL